MQSIIELPDPLKALLLMGVTIAVTEGLKWISGLLKRDLSGYSAQVASAIVAAILVLVNAVLSHVPAQFEPIANSILSLIVVLLGAWGAYKFGKQIKAPKG